MRQPRSRTLGRRKRVPGAGALAPGDLGPRRGGMQDGRHDVLRGGRVVDEVPGQRQLRLRVVELAALEGEERQLGTGDDSRPDRAAGRCRVRSLPEDQLGPVAMLVSRKPGRDPLHDDGRREPRAGGRQGADGGRGVEPHPLDAVPAEERAHGCDPRVDRAAVGHQAVVAGVLRRERPALGLVGTSTQRVDPHAEDGDGGVSLKQFLVVEHAPASARPSSPCRPGRRGRRSP